MATASSILEQLQLALTCYVCSRSFLNPSTLDCGHNYCHSCILSYWQESGPEASCPKCQKKVSRANAPLNKQLVNLVKLTGELSGQLRGGGGRRGRCQEHQEALQSFCTEDLTAFCSACDDAQEHQSHHVLPAVKAAAKYKHHFLRCAEILEEEKKKIYKNDSAEEAECTKLSKQMFQEKNVVVAELKALRRYLRHVERHLVPGIVGTLEKTMAWHKTVRAALLFREELAFDDILRELKEKDREPPHEFLQDIRNPLEKCKKRFLGLLTIPAQVKLYIWEQFDFNAFLRAVVCEFKNILSLGHQMEKANVTLDPDTAHPRLIISADYKHLRLGRTYQNFPVEDQRFDLVACVLGREEFEGHSRCYWDVVLTGTGSWAVGVANRSVRRRGLDNFGSVEGVWVMLKSNRMHGFVGAQNYIFAPIDWTVKRIRVYLNYPAERIAFFDPDKGVLLHEFTRVLFCDEPVLPFFWINGGGVQLSLPEVADG